MAIYKQNIPQPTDLLAVSQVDLLNNATYLDTFLEVEHQQSGRDNSAVGSGRHKTVSMPNQGAAPAVPAGTTGILYQLTNELYHRNATRITQLTGNFAAAASGWTILAGGIKLQWGLRTTPNSSGVISFVPPFSAPPWTIQVSLYRASGNQSVTIDSGTPPTAAGFNYLTSSGGSIGIYWFAIGPA
jgi:hypothetical protein